MLNRDINGQLVDRLYKDIMFNDLQDVGNPASEELERYQKEEIQERDRLRNNLDEGIDCDKILSNLSIPIEVRIWVDKVIDLYLKERIPMLGFVHVIEEAKVRLYSYRGYKYFTINETHPRYIFD